MNTGHALSAQVASAVLMVRPRNFAANPQTAESNVFQVRSAGHDAGTGVAARAEFDAAVDRLQRAGIDVLVLEDSASPPKPDAVFPNNWVSFHPDGTMVLYPLLAPNRRTERRPLPVEALLRQHGFRIDRVVDLSPMEARGWFLEGTGSLVLDRVHAVAYAALSSRTHPQAVAAVGHELAFDMQAFATTGPGGQPFYHTNVMLSIGSSFAVLCAEAVEPAAARTAVMDRLAATGRELLVISADQAGAFAGNVLELATAGGSQLLALSETALQALAPAQIAMLERHAGLVPLRVPTIEQHGGGSVRCMLAEIFLPRVP